MDVKTPKSTDRRVLRTRRALREALMALLSERGWDAVSVQDLCDRADVGRSTFYMHFADKEELVIGGLDDLRKELRAQRAAEPGARVDGLGFARGVIEHAHEQQRLFRAIIGKHSGHAVQQRFRQFVIALVKEDLTGLGLAGRPRDAIAHYVAGAFLELLTWWLDGRSPLQPAEVEDLFRRLTTPVLAASRSLALT
jgi:AcrR family transcriptional regulator